MASMHQPLGDYLAALPAETARVTLTFAEVEALLGAPLPPGAYGPRFWKNAPRWRSRAPVQAQAWQSVGWRSAGARWMPGGVRAVTFVRADSSA